MMDEAAAGDEVVVNVREAEPEPAVPRLSHFGTAVKWCCPHCMFEVIAHRHVTADDAHAQVVEHMARCSN